MKIQHILNEDGGAMLAFRQLSPLQVGILRKIVKNSFNYEDASPQAKDAVETLIGFGLVDELTMEANDRGYAALSMADKYGTTDRNNRAVASSRKTDVPSDMSTDMPDDDQEFEIE
jgi:hypothetical protein